MLRMKDRFVFVAYPYSFSKADYRRVYREVGSRHGVRFQYADEMITNRHILEKIAGMIRHADFSIFDITAWNANVTLELGIAIGSECDYYIAFNPKVKRKAVPSDLGGIDRLQYHDYSELSSGLDRLLTQRYPNPATPTLSRRQRQLLAALCRSYYKDERPSALATNRQLAEELRMSTSTVIMHLRGLAVLFGLSDLPPSQRRVALAEAAIEQGIVSRDEYRSTSAT
jgi:DNA-binding NarL/FixJ family response regulator